MNESENTIFNCRNTVSDQDADTILIAELDHAGLDVSADKIKQLACEYLKLKRSANELELLGANVFFNEVPLYRVPNYINHSSPCIGGQNQYFISLNHPSEVMRYLSDPLQFCLDAEGLYMDEYLRITEFTNNFDFVNACPSCGGFATGAETMTQYLKVFREEITKKPSGGFQGLFCSDCQAEATSAVISKEYSDFFEDVTRLALNNNNKRKINEMLSGVELSHRSRDGDIYFIREKNEGHIKIGRALNFEDRLKTFNVKLPFQIEPEHVFRCSDYIASEKRLHDFFAQYRVDGEWFQLSDEDLQMAKDELFLAQIGIRVISS